ncbi:MAG: DUF4238 domain-containing protein [Hyphomicrobiales bacterium]|nr:MAG: DUF4238 domain-containing protein [Hyphomicrobiales bacterium]
MNVCRAMSDPKKHHHVPQFLLEGWSRADGRVAVYSRKANRVVIDWRTPEYTAFEPHLYSISALPEDREWVEREVMSKRVDAPAAPIPKRLLDSDLKNFNSDDRTAWARFLMAQWWRSPEVIAKLRQGGREAMLRALEANPEEYEALRVAPHMAVWWNGPRLMRPATMKSPPWAACCRS